MKPVSPVLVDNPLQLPEIVFAKDQPKYQPLPAIRTDDGIVVSRWSLTWRERLRVLFSGSIWLQLFMGLDERGRHRLLTPSYLQVKPPQFTVSDETQSKLCGRCGKPGCENSHGHSDPDY